MEARALFGPPGTGKTTELLRQVEVARERGYSPQDIGFFAFTRAAAGEALKRLGLTRSDKIATLHSLAFRHVGATPPAVVDSYKLRRFGKEAGIAFSGSQSDEYGEQMEVGDKYLAIYNLARSRLRDKREEYYDSDERPGDYAQFLHCVDSYEAWKTAYGFMDFTDMIARYVAAPRNHGAKILFIDEAQDLSDLQWLMVEQMLKFDQVEEVVIAGDDDQAIYEWSGANPHGMKEFVTNYDAVPTTLAQSYRVPGPVHELARSIVSTIKERVKKRYRPAAHEGNVRRFGQFDPKSVEHGDDVLILCRSHTQKKEVEEELIAVRKPYKIEGGKPGLYDSIWAEGFRALHKLKAGNDITPTQLEALAKVATSSAKAELNTRNFSALVKRAPDQAIAVPSHLIEFFREADLSQTPTIRISTIHAAKGREARHVVLHTGITARTEVAMDKNPDAEARVWYVGVTRAIAQLDIVAGTERSYNL